MLSPTRLNDVRILHFEPVAFRGSDMRAVLVSSTVQLFGRTYAVLHGR
jgi:hypothetical protein